MPPKAVATAAASNKEVIGGKQKELEQLRHEAHLPRLPISETARDMVQFCEDNKQHDPQMNGFTNTSANPFQEKRSCVIL